MGCRVVCARILWYNNKWIVRALSAHQKNHHHLVTCVSWFFPSSAVTTTPKKLRSLLLLRVTFLIGHFPKCAVQKTNEDVSLKIQNEHYSGGSNSVHGNIYIYFGTRQRQVTNENVICRFWTFFSILLTKRQIIVLKTRRNTWTWGWARTYVAIILVVCLALIRVK